MMNRGKGSHLYKSDTNIDIIDKIRAVFLQDPHTIGKQIIQQKHAIHNAYPDAHLRYYIYVNMYKKYLRKYVM